MKAYNDTTYAILGILTTDCKSGYAIKQFIDRSLSHFWKISYGQIYPTLKLIVQEGLAEVNVSTTSGRSDRNEYHLTSKGMDTLKNWLEQPLQQAPVERNEVLLKLFFGSYQSPEKTIAILQDYKNRLEIRYEMYETIEKGIHQHNKDEKDAMYWLMTLDYGKRVTEAAIKWCDHTLKNWS
ncbi:PadR family transcriptional regulator [Halalkalibacter akibai]|uniref:Transcriptional regulator n=1 Tax=Halalkalibacter akibai (strain ATCC 43226 / DSM 21942 / CIP 109018 / JCM 9157 / 1139) TaxID=1236973 RepID=W4QS61_HALA3|nr:PadR family transcriptional regulator [Halalkalibacter akibai]GAE34458.1 transcriptional regulator [Halalkalibacter akibai JCM 9157]